MNNLEFDDIGVSASGKTKVWEVRSVHNGSMLGWVKWYAPWRKYTYVTEAEGVVFDHQCLREVANFCELQTQYHKAA